MTSNQRKRRDSQILSIGRRSMSGNGQGWWREALAKSGTTQTRHFEVELKNSELLAIASRQIARGARSPKGTSLLSGRTSTGRDFGASPQAGDLPGQKQKAETDSRALFPGFRKRADR